MSDKLGFTICKGLLRNERIGVYEKVEVVVGTRSKHAQARILYMFNFNYYNLLKKRAV